MSDYRTTFVAVEDKDHCGPCSTATRIFKATSSRTSGSRVDLPDLRFPVAARRFALLSIDNGVLPEN